MALLRVKNWAKFQHYKGRRPPWIKFHRDTLDDFAFHRLPVASRALAPMIWLLASESNDGSLKYDIEEIAFRLRAKQPEISDAIKPLIDNGFLILEQDACAALAECKQSAMPETERETEEETDKRARKRATRIDPDWKLSEKGNQYALSRGLSAEQIPGEAEHFKDHHLARGSVFADWEAAWRTWVKNAIKFAGKSASRPSQAQPQSVSRGPDDDQLAWLIRKGMRSPSGPSSADCARLARAGKVTLADAARYAMMTAAEFTERFGVSERTAA